VRNIVVYRDKLLAGSETFILNQAESLQHFRPYYVGRRRCGGLTTPIERTFVLNPGGITGALFESLRYPEGLRKKLDPLEPALVHAHFAPDGFRARALSRSLKAPLIVTFHGYDVTTKDTVARRSFQDFRKYIDGRAALQTEGALFIAVSEFIRTRLLEQGFPEERTVVHYVGVRTEDSIPERRIDEPLVLFVGRLVSNKGCDYLIDAMSQVAKRVKQVHLCIIGEGKCRSELETRAKSLSCRVSFLGSQSPTTVRDWMRRASVLCAPSVTIPTGQSEGFGLALIEAQALGVPVVAFRTGGIPESVQDGVTGLLAQAGDVRKLAELLYQVLTDQSLAEELGQNGIKRVRERFDLTKQTQKLERMYDSVSRRP
jgi:glycosyltransferase involved in cell wall biosynthesis